MQVMWGLNSRASAAEIMFHALSDVEHKVESSDTGNHLDLPNVNVFSLKKKRKT